MWADSLGLPPFLGGHNLADNDKVDALARSRNKKPVENGKMLSTQPDAELCERVARVFRWREAETGKTQGAVAVEVGATAEMANKWVRGHQTPSPAYLVKMVEEWPLNGHWLLTGDGPMEVQPADVVRPSVRTLEALRDWLETVLGGATTASHEPASDLAGDDVMAGYELTQQVVAHLERAVRARQGSR